MTTTYSPSLRLWEGSPGDPAIRDTWGTSLDTNFSLLDSAITGTAAIDLTGLLAWTLTVANGAPDQARPLRQNFTGTPAANCTIAVPNVPKIGYASNNTTGGFNLVLTSGPGTTAIIPPGGAWYLYYADGAGNVVLPFIGGQFGDYRSAASGVGITLISTTSIGLVSLQLPAGDWDVDGVAHFIPPSGGNFSQIAAYITRTPNAIGLGIAFGYVNLSAPFTGQEIIGTGRTQIFLSSPATIWLAAYSVYAGGSGVATAPGMIQARRMH